MKTLVNYAGPMETNKGESIRVHIGRFEALFRSCSEFEAASIHPWNDDELDVPWQFGISDANDGLCSC